MNPKSTHLRAKKKSTDRKKSNSKSNDLPGWPGYRTRDGRSGYDPIDTRAESGHMAGTIIQKLIGGQIRNRVHLFLVSIFGLILITHLILAVSETLNGNQFPWSAWLFLLIVGTAVIALLNNCIKNLFEIIRQK